MKFKKYQHVERFGTLAVDGILQGDVYVFSKIDGANVCLYLNDSGNLEAGSRNQVIEDDFRGLIKYLEQNLQYLAYLQKYPKRRLYGEWLVPHHIKDYRPDAWNKLYIFDVVDYETEKYIPYSVYSKELDEFGIDYIPLIAKFTNPSSSEIEVCLNECTYLMADNKPGEGIVIKNYDYINKFGKIIWAKWVREVSSKTHKVIKESDKDDSIEEKIVNKFLTNSFIEKEFAKLALNSEDKSIIPKFLSSVWYTFISEEMVNILHKFKNPTINFSRLNKLVIQQIKLNKSELFK